MHNGTSFDTNRGALLNSATFLLKKHKTAPTHHLKFSRLILGGQLFIWV